jgi:hypothetical protein
VRGTPSAVNKGHAVLARQSRSTEWPWVGRLAAAHALGSLAHGGFSPQVSDVDLGLVLADPLRASDAATVGAVASAERDRGGELRGRVSVF